MHKIVLIGWGVMLAAFIYSTRELQCGKGSTIVTSSTYPSVLSDSQQSRASLHRRGDYTWGRSPMDLGGSCRSQQSNYFGLVKYAVLSNAISADAEPTLRIVAAQGDRVQGVFPLRGKNYTPRSRSCLPKMN